VDEGGAGHNGAVTIKATALLSIAAIWASVITAVVLEHGGWWALIFAALATGAVGASAWRRLGLSRLAAIAGAWGGTSAAIATNSDTTWMSVFAFLATGAVVYGFMRRDALLIGLAIAAAWGITGVVAARDHEGAWICVFAFLTAGALANSRRNASRALVSIAAWGGAGAVMLATQEWYWLSVFAFLFSTVSFGLGGIAIPRRIEWDLFDRDEPRHGGDGVIDAPPVTGTWRGWRGQRRGP
jgi:hypothetical protein